MLNNKIYPKFIYLSQLIDLRIIDMNNRKTVGSIYDIVAEVREMYPRIIGIIIQLKKGKKKAFIAWNSVKSIIENKALEIDDYSETITINHNLQPHEILLRETFLDKQIVDISGSKLVRVNDLHILRDDFKLFLVHVDVGFSGLLRRLGWLTFINTIIRWLFTYEMKDKLISWKYVQPLQTGEVKSVALKISQAKLAKIIPADLADIIIDLGTSERLNIFRSLDIKTAAETIQELPLKIGLQISEMLSMESLISLMDEVAIDEAVDLLSEMENKKANSVLAGLPGDKAGQIRDLMKHPERIAGSLMNPEFISVSHTAKVSKVINKIKLEAEEAEFIYYVYILDDVDKLAGVVTMKELLLAEPDVQVESLIKRKVVSVEVGTHIKKVAQVFFKYNFVVVPVVDEDNYIKGIITMKDALETVFPEIREETEETP